MTLRVKFTLVEGGPIYSQEMTLAQFCAFCDEHRKVRDIAALFIDGGSAIYDFVLARCGFKPFRKPFRKPFGSWL